MEFPIYARTPDSTTHYLISSDRRFEEWRRLGASYLHQVVEAADYSDALYIRDLIDRVTAGDIVRMEEDEWQLFSAKTK